MPTLLVFHSAVKKYFILNDFLLSKVSEENSKEVQEDLQVII